MGVVGQRAIGLALREDFLQPVFEEVAGRLGSHRLEEWVLSLLCDIMRGMRGGLDDLALYLHNL